jgi:hypothetical protein
MEFHICQRKTILASAQHGAAGGQSNWFRVDDVKEALLFILVSAKEGTNPTLDITIQTSPEDIDTPSPRDAFVLDNVLTITDVVNQVQKISNFGKWIRISYAIGGTNTPKFTFEIKWIGKS